ncbi:hypothetical protein [Kitasatospora sp. NPDC057015]|uniref:hypothetical protein n=1 Tax=Kitasatospora sp. NPDC057015 TaxID=3346001 RepID=UPI003626C71A
MKCEQDGGAGGAVTVEIEDIVRPAEFNRLPDAVAALWAALRMLPLGWTQYEAYRRFLGPGAVRRVEESIERDGELTLAFRMAGRVHLIRIAPVARTRRADGVRSAGTDRC